MENYLKKNSEYYEKGYEAENIESYVFRFYGRILKHDFKMDGSKNEKILDFGCGAGSALNFFKSKGFNVHGVDISVKDINRAKTIMPDIKNNLLITIIPQQIQVRLLKQGKKNDALSFDREVLKICKDIQIQCVSFTEKLSKKLNYKTHFVKDGHLYPLANIEYGKLLGEYLISKGF